MRQSKLFTKTSKEISSDEQSLNAKLLIRAGFVDKLMAGVYTYLPLGLRVLDKIKNIIREEMNNIGGQEILMPALTPKENWEKTGRWDSLDVLFRLKGAGDKEYALGATHEEIVTPLLRRFVNSYKDLPVAVYQIQDKFRNEPRAKSGLLRGREFSMKDLYSFHANEKDLDEYYEKAKGAYASIYKRCDLDAKLVEASGGTFSKYSHEYQVFSDFGEDLVFTCEKCDRHQNREIVEDKKCSVCGSKLVEHKAIEVGNIFKLKTKYSSAFDFKYVDEAGKRNDVIMGAYGIGPSRMIGAIVETHHDDNGMVWPEAVAPYRAHLIFLGNERKIIDVAEDYYNELTKLGVEVLCDDRKESAGIKLKDSDLIGLPIRLVVSEKTLSKDCVEVKKRGEENSQLMKWLEVKKMLKK